MTYTYTGTTTVTGTGTLTSAGKTLGPLIINGSGITVTQGDALSLGSSILTVTLGTFTTSTNNYSLTIGELSSSNANVRSILLNASTVTLTGALFNVINFITSTNLTFNAGTSQIYVGTVGGSNLFQWNTGGQTFYDVFFGPVFNGYFVLRASTTTTFRNLTVYPPPDPATPDQISFSLGGNVTVTGTLTCSGASAIARAAIYSDTQNTSRTLTVNSLVANDCDFLGITLAGAAAGTAPVRAGNVGGNSGITFPAAKTVYWNLAGTGFWTDNAWATTPTGTPAVNNFPLPQDTAAFTNAGAADTVNISEFYYYYPTIDASGRTTPMTLDQTAIQIYGSYILGSGVTVTASGNSLIFSGTGTMNLVSAGKTLPFTLVIDSWNNAGTVRLSDALNLTGEIELTSGTLDLNNQNVTCATFYGDGSVTRAMIMGSSTFTLTASGAPNWVWRTTTITNFTFNAGTSNIVLTDDTTDQKNFLSSGLTFYKLTIGGPTATSTLRISGSNNTFNEIASTKAVAHTITFTNNLTINNWTATGTAGNVVTVRSTTTGTQRTITYGGGQTNLDYMSFRDINFSYVLDAANPYKVYAGANSTNAGNNAGIAFINGLTQKAYLLTSGTTWTVPADWNNNNNTIHMIGGGGGPVSPALSGNNRAAGAGGGGGGYRVLTNQTLTGAIPYTIGAGGGLNANGGNTTFNTTNTAGGGAVGTNTTTPSSAGGAGGSGTFSGGNGGAGAFGTTASQGYGGGGGGGAGGPNGAGGAGGNGFGSTTNTQISGGGGGGNGGGADGTDGSSNLGGSGGNNFSGTGGAVGGTGTGAAGTLGGGGAGGGSQLAGTPGTSGAGIDIANTIGGAGGRGGSAGSSGIGTAGVYGGGGGGTYVLTSGTGGSNSSGSQGVIFIVYAPLTPSAPVILSGVTISGGITIV
jgi:hypothetical protein